MTTPQSAILPETALAGIFIEADIVRPKAVPAACQSSLKALETLQQRFAGDDLGLTIAFGQNGWRHFSRAGEAGELKPFRTLGRGNTTAPASQHDLLLHIQSKNHDSNFTLALAVLDAFGDAVTVASETHGFRRHENRGLDGFVDGTENPKGDKITATAVIADGAADAGGSYVLYQRYLHDLKKWASFSVAGQEESVARSKETDEEFSKTDRHPRSHIARTNLKENGVGLKIVRRSLPFGTASGEHGLAFIAYAARLHNIEAQLLSMFGETEDGLTDLLLERLSRAVSGGYYFAPPVERLRALVRIE